MLVGQAGTIARSGASAPGKSPVPTRAQLQDGVAHSSSGLRLALETQVMVSPTARIPAGREQPASALRAARQRLPGRACGKAWELECAHLSPAAGTFPAFVRPADLWKNGNTRTGRRVSGGLCDSPQRELGHLSLPGAWPDGPGKSKSSSMGKFCKEKSLLGPASPTVPLGPAALACLRCCAAEQGAGPVVVGVAWRLALLAAFSALAPTPRALAAAGSLPQRCPTGSSTAHGCKRGSPKARAGLAACLGLISHYDLLQLLLTSCPGGPQALQTKLREGFTAWGHRQAQGVMLGPHTAFSSLRWQQGARCSATLQRDGKAR